MPTVRTALAETMSSMPSYPSQVVFDSEVDALTYDARHVEYTRDSDWLDPSFERFAVIAVGRYLAILDVDAFMEEGSPSAYSPILPNIAAPEIPTSSTGMSTAPPAPPVVRVRLPHSDDIRSISASPFRIGLVASGGFDRRLVISDVMSGVGGDVLQVRSALHNGHIRSSWHL